MSEDLPAGLDTLFGHLLLLHPQTRDDLRSKLGKLLSSHDSQLLDSHNTPSMIYVFTADGVRYGLKIEYGAAEVTRDEAHWYDLAPAELKPHFVASHVADGYAFVLLRWLERAETVEQLAMQNEGNTENPTIELVLQVLRQDRLLFDSNSVVPLLSGAETGYFYDKYRSYNAQAKDFPYLQALLQRDTVRVNGVELPGPERFVQAVQGNDELRNYLSPERAGLIHGDTHVDNILVENDRIYFIDPKGVDHLPLEYDTGRVMWSLTGWNAIVGGDYRVKSTDDSYQLDVTIRQQYRDGLPRIVEYFSKQEYHRARYSAAIQYLTRVSHATNEPETTALYLRGLQLFYELFEELGAKA